ncbi:Mariner Mos1 transposase [Eumeta japonica]|uniref:Mariner Mos1 transposase n=1 Tax=Eumeta variegata TaxID=151549 RepID=A0A4C1Y0A6_EUMVA|nr:Mariner Mos1 transposase [Eumeta japonica]
MGTTWSRVNIRSKTEYSRKKLMICIWWDQLAVPVKNYLKTLDWGVLPHPPYSPATAPSDYHLFRSMAYALSEQRFTSYEDNRNRVDSWIYSKDKKFFRLGIRTLPE